MPLVFAYGSNLCVQRMLARAPSARVVAVASLAGHALRWHKAGRDGSGKCDAFFTGNDDDVVHGVVYDLTQADKRALDRFEGLGEHYGEKLAQLVAAPGGGFRRDGETQDGNDARERVVAGALEATVYVALPGRVDANARPWTWYRDHVLTGARQHGLPAHYVARIEAVEAAEDPDRRRHRRETLEREAGPQPRR